MLHQKTTEINIYTDVDSSVVYFKDTEECYLTPATINVTRSKSDIELIVKKDSLTKMVTLTSRLSTGFWVGNLFGGAGVIGYAIDLTSPKRFTYPYNNYISLLGDRDFEKTRPQRWIPPVKNQLNFKISIPEGNHFYLNKGKGYGNAFGFLGISAGLEYYLSDVNSINMDVGTITDFMVPFPAPVDYGGSYNRSFASYVDLQVGRDIKAFHFDVGVQGNRTSYYERETVELFPNYIDTLKYATQQYQAGLAFSSYYKLTETFNIGLNYYPSLFAWSNGTYHTHYNHLIMFELIFKIKGYRPKTDRPVFKNNKRNGT